MRVRLHHRILRILPESKFLLQVFMICSYMNVLYPNRLFGNVQLLVLIGYLVWKAGFLLFNCIRLGTLFH